MLLFGILIRCVGRETALHCLHPVHSTREELFSKYFSRVFRWRMLVCKIKTVSQGQAKLAGNYQRTYKLFNCYFGYQYNNDKAQMKELILIQGKHFNKFEIPEGISFYGLEKRLQF